MGMGHMAIVAFFKRAIAGHHLGWADLMAKTRGFVERAWRGIFSALFAMTWS
jgi:hypothetical protein